MAVDSARMAARFGAEDVTIVYRRSTEEMPAIRDEVKAAQQEGVKIRYMSSPCQVLCEGEECKGIECFQTELGELDECGRKKPLRVEGSEFVLDADMVISAIGEMADLSFLDADEIEVGSTQTIQINPDTLATNKRGIFAGGDVVTGAATVIEAIAAGRKAAVNIDRYLRGKDLEAVGPEPGIIAFESLDTTGIKRRQREKMPCLQPEERVQGFREVEEGFAELAALREADRCLQCGMFPKK